MFEEIVIVELGSW